jgi:hypothetical protein
VRWERTGRLVEALAGREPAWRRCSKRRHAKCARWPSGEWSRTAREATWRTKAVLIWASGATRAAKGRIATGRELAMWGEVVGRLLLTLLILRRILTRLRLRYLS